MAISLVGPDGRRYVLQDAAELANAKAQGFREEEGAPQTPGEEIKGALSSGVESLGQGAIGALHGYTFGLSKTLEGAHAPPESDQLTPSGMTGDPLSGSPAQIAADFKEAKRKREDHELARGVGEFVGMVASPINKIAAPIEAGIGAATVAGRIAAKGLSNAAVGTLFGAGNAVGDSVLGDHDLTAEKLIAGGGLGAVLGGAGGLFGGALEEGAKAAMPAISKALAGADGDLSEFADGRWLKAVNSTKDQIRKIPEAERAATANVIREHMTGAGIMPKSIEEASASMATEREAIAKKMLETVGVGDAGGLTPKMSQDDALAAIGKALDTNGEKIGEVLKKADAMGAHPDYSRAWDRFTTFENGLNLAEKDLISKDLEKVRGYLVKLSAAPPAESNFSALNSIKSTIQKDTNWVADGAAKYGLKRQLAGILRDEIDTQLAPQIGADLSKEFLDAKAAFGALSNAEKALGRKTATGADAIRALIEDASLQQPSLAGKMSALEHGTRLVAHGMDRTLGNRFISPSDYLTGMAGAVLHGGPLGALTGVASAVAHKAIRENGSAVIAKLADKISRSPVLSTTAASFAKTLPVAAASMGRAAQPVVEAASQSAAHALATHMVMAQVDPAYSHAAQLAGLVPETPEQHEAGLARAGSIATIAAAVQKQDAELANHVKAVIRGAASPKHSAALDSQDFGAKRMRRDSADGHKQRIDEIRNFSANPSALVERITANLGKTADIAPGVAAAVAKTANRVVQYLTQESQEPPKAGPLAPDWVHTDAEIHAFSLKLEAAQNPSSTLKSAASRTLTSEQVATVSACYPTWYRSACDAMVSEAIHHPDMPYASKLMVSLFTGMDLDGSLGPSLYRTQTAINASKASNPSPDKVTSEPGKLTLAQRTATPSERAEMKQKEA